SYRAAAILLARLEPLLAALDQGIPTFDVRAAVLAEVASAIAAIPDALLAGLATIGRILRDDVGGLMTAIGSLTVSVSGPSPVAAGTPTHRDDDDPQPFTSDHWLWAVDLGSEIVALFWQIWGFQRARGVKRATEWIELVLSLAWRGVRVGVRLFKQPDWLNKEASGFVRMLFSEWGDLFMRLLFMLIGSIQDMVAWSNFVMGFGNRFLKWFALEVQPRMVYLFLRSAWYLRSWHDDPDTATRGDPKFVRALWAGWAPALLIVAIIGFCLPGDGYDLQSVFDADYPTNLAWGLVAMILQVIGAIFMPWILLGEHPFRGYRHDSFDFIALSIATLAVAFIAIESLGSTNVGEGTAGVLRWVVYIVFGLVALLVILGQSLSDPPAAGDGPPWYDVIGAIEGWIVAIVGAVGLALVTMVVWWFARRDGEDTDKEFVVLDPAASPYHLPYPKGESWFCGQGFHGIFSHTWRSGHNKGEVDNVFGYDFNNAFGEPACAARAGLVTHIDVTNADGGGTANEVHVQHWDWTPVYDPGSTDERQLTRAMYLHLAKERARAVVGQRVEQGYNVAAIDDTGFSALNHLHFQVFTTTRRKVENKHGSGRFVTEHRDVSLPTLFRDDSARGFRSFGHIPGKPISLAWYTSDNVGGPSDDVTRHPVLQPFTATAAEAAKGGHTHTLALTDDQFARGPLPDPLVLYTSVADGHAHEVRLTRDQLRALLSAGTATTEASTGPTGPTTAPTQPASTSHTHTLRADPRLP
ncbi:MAG TPA: M23 family metallopeptidase, partial [Myxococcota bacterium]|nr:M23 family metallopeptidase [Myxococcota bacterium]